MLYFVIVIHAMAMPDLPKNEQKMILEKTYLALSYLNPVKASPTRNIVKTIV